MLIYLESYLMLHQYCSFASQHHRSRSHTPSRQTGDQTSVLGLTTSPEVLGEPPAHPRAGTSLLFPAHPAAPHGAGAAPGSDQRKANQPAELTTDPTTGFQGPCPSAA